MKWRVDTRRMMGRKAEPVVVLELSEEEMLDLVDLVAEAKESRPDLGPNISEVDMRAAHLALGRRR